MHFYDDLTFFREKISSVDIHRMWRYAKVYCTEYRLFYIRAYV